MWEYIGQVIWFFLPAGIANMAASLSRFVPILNYPIDLGVSWHGQRLLGNHKTWRGAVFGIVFGVAFFLLQRYFYKAGFFSGMSIFDYRDGSWLVGWLLSGGAIIGDAVRSFFKRRINIAPGHPWFPFDQVDYVVGAALLVSFVFFPGWWIIIVAIFLGILFHVLVNISAYLIGLQRNKL